MAVPNDSMAGERRFRGDQLPRRGHLGSGARPAEFLVVVAPLTHF